MADDARDRDARDRDARDRAAFRRWARENHPDVGGDPEVFALGMQALRAGRWDAFVHGGPDTGGDAEHVPVYVRRSIHGVARVIVAAQRWNERRKRPPRVH